MNVVLLSFQILEFSWKGNAHRIFVLFPILWKYMHIKLCEEFLKCVLKDGACSSGGERYIMQLLANEPGFTLTCNFQYFTI